MYEKTYIIAYGGEPRQKRGQIIFVLSLENPSARYRCINWSPSGNYLLCLEEGQHMYPSLTCGTNRVRVLYYNSTTFCVNEIRFSSPLVPRPAMNTKFLWLDASTFIFADEKKDNFKSITLRKNRTYEETIFDLSPTLEPFRQNENRTKNVSYVNSFFVLPDVNSPHLFFLTCCSTEHQHQRLLYVDKKTHKVDKIASLPGEVIEIAVTKTKFFLLLQSRPYEDYKYNTPILATEKIDFQKCLFSEPFRSKMGNGNFENYPTDAAIYESHPNGIFLFRPACCCTLVSSELWLKKKSNFNLEMLFEYFTRVARASNLYVTNDYLYYVDNIRQRTKVFGLHHHLSFEVFLKDEYVFPVTNYVTYFHPNKPIFLRKKSPSYFDLYLLPWATDDDMTNYPEIAEDESAGYNENVTFVPN